MRRPASFCQQSAEQFRSEYPRALRGDYGAQRNVAYCLITGRDGAVRTDRITGCAWRAIRAFWPRRRRSPRPVGPVVHIRDGDTFVMRAGQRLQQQGFDAARVALGRQSASARRVMADGSRPTGTAFIDAKCGMPLGLPRAFRLPRLIVCR
jgi:hypothetical protein